jgi:hypothetical protein
MRISSLFAIASIAAAFAVSAASARAGCTPGRDLKGTWYWNMAWFDETGAFNQGTFPWQPYGVYGPYADIGTEACKVQIGSDGSVVPGGSSCVYSDNRDGTFFDIGFFPEKVVGGKFEVSSSCVVSGQLAIEYPPDEFNPFPIIYFVRLFDARLDSRKSTIGFTAGEWYEDFPGLGSIWGTYTYQGTMVKQPGRR